MGGSGEQREERKRVGGWLRGEGRKGVGGWLRREGRKRSGRWLRGGDSRTKYGE